MILHGTVQRGMVVFDPGDRLPEGARVAVVPEDEPPTRETMTCEEHRRVLEILDRVATLPLEGNGEPFRGADHDQILYGR